MFYEFSVICPLYRVFNSVPVVVLNVSDTLYMQVAIHDKDEEPIMTGLSYSAGVSADTSLIIQKREVCHDIVSSPSHPSINFSVC